jgi:hypothetical protein
MLRGKAKEISRGVAVIGSPTTRSAIIGGGPWAPSGYAYYSFPHPRENFHFLVSDFTFGDSIPPKRLLSPEHISRIKICLSVSKKLQKNGNWYQKTQKIQFYFLFFSKWTFQEKNISILFFSYILQPTELTLFLWQLRSNRGAYLCFVWENIVSVTLSRFLHILDQAKTHVFFQGLRVFWFS